MFGGVREDDWKARCIKHMSSSHKGKNIQCAVIVCENGVAEVCDKHKADLGCKTGGCAHYAVHCLNGKAVVK